LKKKREELSARLEELLGEANVCNGALQDIDYWLDILEKPEHRESQGQSFPASFKSSQETLSQTHTNETRVDKDSCGKPGELHTIPPSVEKKTAVRLVKSQRDNELGSELGGELGGEVGI
jgi:hypothetical protein